MNNLIKKKPRYLLSFGKRLKVSCAIGNCPAGGGNTSCYFQAFVPAEREMHHVEYNQ